VYNIALVKILFPSVFGVQVTPEQWVQVEQVVKAVAGLLVAIGIFSYNPFQKKGVEE